MGTRTMGAQKPAGEPPESLSLIVGLVAVVFSGLYFVSDLFELAQGGFSTPQLALTLAAEAAIPFLVLGLYAVQRLRVGRLGFAGAVGYAYSFVIFTGTVLFALVTRTGTYEALVDSLGPWMTAHGAVMVLAGLAFGLAVIRARHLPDGRRGVDAPRRSGRRLDPALPGRPDRRCRGSGPRLRRHGRVTVAGAPGTSPKPRPGPGSGALRHGA